MSDSSFQSGCRTNESATWKVAVAARPSSSKGGIRDVYFVFVEAALLMAVGSVASGDDDDAPRYMNSSQRATAQFGDSSYSGESSFRFRQPNNYQLGTSFARLFTPLAPLV